MLLEFIPMIGPLTAGAVILVVALISGAHFWAVLIFLVAYRMFQDYVLSPHLMGQGVELHPLLVLFGVFAGAEVAGIAGSFLSVPGARAGAHPLPANPPVAPERPQPSPLLSR